MKRNLVLTFALSTLWLTPSAAQAQTAPTASNPSPQMEHLIHALSGSWVTRITYAPSDLLPKGGSGSSRDSYRAGPARLSLIEEYHGTGAGGTTWGTGVIWWDQPSQGFRFVWCDSFAVDAGCRVSSETGNWQNDIYVATDVHDVQGKKIFEKEVWSNFTPNSFTQTLYLGESRDSLKLFMTIKARRIAKP